jgi:hypothetical protein
MLCFLWESQAEDGAYVTLLLEGMRLCQQQEHIPFSFLYDIGKAAKRWENGKPRAVSSSKHSSACHDNDGRAACAQDKK